MQADENMFVLKEWEKKKECVGERTCAVGEEGALVLVAVYKIFCRAAIGL